MLSWERQCTEWGSRRVASHHHRRARERRERERVVIRFHLFRPSLSLRLANERTNARTHAMSSSSLLSRRSGRAIIIASTCRRAYAAASSTIAPRGQSETLSYARPVASPSKDYAEAQRRGRDFYRDICREIPWIMDNYSLREVTTETRLRRAVKDLLRANMANIERYPEEKRAGVLDVALLRAREELIAVEAHHYQRHHLITNFVNSSAVKANDGKDRGKSAFLRDFLATQRTELN